MSMILGMDPWVFTAWIGTILAAVACVLYGIYDQFLRKSGNEKTITKEKGAK